MVDHPEGIYILPYKALQSRRASNATFVDHCGCVSTRFDSRGNAVRLDQDERRPGCVAWPTSPPPPPKTLEPINPPVASHSVHGKGPVGREVRRGRSSEQPFASPHRATPGEDEIRKSWRGLGRPCIRPVRVRWPKHHLSSLSLSISFIVFCRPLRGWCSDT